MQPQLPQVPGSNLLAALTVDLIKNSLCLILATEPQRAPHDYSGVHCSPQAYYDLDLKYENTPASKVCGSKTFLVN